MSSQIQTTASDPIQLQTGESKPYPPSFVDKLMGAIERLPIPYGLTYLAFFLLQSLATLVLGWVDGWLPAYTLNPMVFLFPLWLWGPLAIMTYLNSVSRNALSKFGALLDIRPDVMRRLEYELTTMPAKRVIQSGLFWSCIYFVSVLLAFDTFFVAFGLGAFPTVFMIIAGWVSYFIGSAIYYHSLRQLSLVHRIVKMVKQFDLFRLEPVYAFSILTSRTGIAWVLLLSLTMLIFPIQIAIIPSLVTLTLQVILALAAFALPLWVVHQRLDSEKRTLQAEVDLRIKSTLARLHRSLDEQQLDEVGQLSSALGGLIAERDLVAKIPTWPWRAGLLTGFLSLVVLPIILFLVQLLIGNFLGI